MQEILWNIASCIYYYTEISLNKPRNMHASNYMCDLDPFSKILSHYSYTFLLKVYLVCMSIIVMCNWILET